jgi:hypothetical protein
VHCRLYTSTRYVTGAGKLLLHSTSAEAGRLVATQCDDHSVRNCAFKAAYTNSVCHSSRQVVASQHRSGAGKLVATQCDGHWAQTLCIQGCTHQLGMSLQQASCRYTAKVLEQANFSLHSLMAIRPRHCAFKAAHTNSVCHWSRQVVATQHKCWSRQTCRYPV